MVIEWVCHDCGAEGIVIVLSEDYWKCMLDVNAAHDHGRLDPSCNSYWAAIFPKDYGQVLPGDSV